MGDGDVERVGRRAEDSQSRKRKIESKVRNSHSSGARTFLSALGIQCSYEHERTNAKAHEFIIILKG